jgi:hypothetical protein
VSRTSAGVIAHHPDPFGRDRNIEDQVAGSSTREEKMLLDHNAIDSEQISRITAQRMIFRESDDTLDIVARVGRDGRPRGPRAPTAVSSRR